MVITVNIIEMKLLSYFIIKYGYKVYRMQAFVWNIYVFNMIWCERLYFKFSIDHLMPGLVSPLNELWDYKEQGIKEILCAMKLCIPLLYCLEVVFKYFEFVMLFTAGVSTGNLLPYIAISVLVMLPYIVTSRLWHQVVW